MIYIILTLAIVGFLTTLAVFIDFGGCEPKNEFLKDLESNPNIGPYLK